MRGAALRSSRTRRAGPGGRGERLRPSSDGERGRTLAAMTRPLAAHFPPRPRSFRGRAGELATLEAAIVGGHVARVALVGAGGSGKSTLACALGHRLRPRYPGGVHWFRVGAWDPFTLRG